MTNIKKFFSGIIKQPQIESLIVISYLLCDCDNGLRKINDEFMIKIK